MSMLLTATAPFNNVGIMEFLQWLGVGGVALLTLWYTQRDKTREKELAFMERLSAELHKKDEQYKELSEKIDKMETLNNEYRQKNLDLMTENTLLKLEKDKLEQSMELRIQELERKNKELQLEIEKLKEQ